MTTEAIVVVRHKGMGWVPSVAQPIRNVERWAVLLTPPMDEETTRRLAPLFDEVIVTDTADVEAMVRAGAELQHRREVLAFVTTEDAMIVPAAQAAERLGVGRTPAAPLEVSRNKYLTRRALHEAGLPTPRFALLGDPEEAASVAERVGFPAVLKPINGAGGHLVRVVRTVEQLQQAWQAGREGTRSGPLSDLYAQPVVVDGVPLDPASTFLVEQFLPGHEYSLDLSITDHRIEHIALADKAILDENFFECGFISPPLDLDERVEARLRACVDDAVRTVGLDNTIAHVEVRDHGPGTTTVIEINAGRPGGQLLAQIFEMNTGINTATELVTVAAGLESARGAPTLPVPLASLTKYAHTSGRLTEINGLDEVQALDDVVAVIPTVRVGDLISAEYEVFAVNLVVAGFMDLEDLLETYERAVGLIELVIDPTG